MNTPMDSFPLIPGATELKAWFGSFPRFHDANVVDCQIDGEGSGYLTAKAFKMTDRVDSEGFFILEKQCLVKLHFEGVTRVALEDFLPGQAVIFGLEIRSVASGFEIEIESSYGFAGVLRMKKLRVDFEPIEATGPSA